MTLFFLAAFPVLSFAVTAEDYYNAGNQLYQQGKLDQALQYYQAATQLDPNDWQAYQLIGYCYYTQKNNPLALQAMDKSLQINPNNPSLKQFADQLRASTPGAPAPATSTSSPSAAKPAAVTDPLFLRLGLGASLPMPSQEQVQYTLGPGGVVELGYTFQPGLAVFLGDDIGIWSAGNSSASITAMDISITADLQLDLLDKDGMKLYVLGGAGMDLLSFVNSSSSGATASETDPAIHLGGGAAFNIGKGLDAFAQIKYGMLFTTEGSYSGTFTYI
ncbi:MAG TPA: tetratricopeptide repeat protein, partial [bacterium]|nr:tetratricopeptide repeat protein [bacterium]